MKTQLKWLEETNECLLVTELSKNVIKVEPLTPEEAAQWQAENRY